MSTNDMAVTGVQSSSSDHLEAHLGDVRWEDGKAYRLVKAAANIASAAKKILVSATSGSNPASHSWSANTTTTANDAHVVGVVPSGISTISSTSGQIDSGDYFYVQVSGDATVISAAAIADNGLVGTSTTAGKADDATVAAGVGACGTALESASGADEDIGVRLKGLL